MQEVDLICFSHLRWNFVFQRPQHLLTRFAKKQRVFYIEEPILDSSHDFYEVTQVQQNLWVIVPHLVNEGTEQEKVQRQENLLKDFFEDNKIEKILFWFYTPMAMRITHSFSPQMIIYDCMDELSAFKFAPAGLKENEDELFKKADLVFTGGHSLFEAKKHRHHQVFSFPSSIDKNHFSQARLKMSEPFDQEPIPHPRIGFYGVIDERMDIELIRNVAEKRPNWHFVIIGPVVKIDENSLPRYNNIHYLGNKSYQELPSYLSGWDIAIIPFALNDSTRFISPTKTPEYLAAGKPVISSSIRDVVTPYAEKKLVSIADSPDDFIAAAHLLMNNENKSSWLEAVDEFLSQNSWDHTWNEMKALIIDKLEDKESKINNLNLKEYIYV